MESIYTRITPDFIINLKPNEIFVFGSNAQGMHAGGAARFAMYHFGAIWGQGEGLQGQSYSIPTMEGFDNIGPTVDQFISYAQQHPEYTFLVTPIGCGIAGYREEQIAPFFKAGGKEWVMQQVVYDLGNVLETDLHPKK